LYFDHTQKQSGFDRLTLAAALPYVPAITARVARSCERRCSAADHRQKRVEMMKRFEDHLDELTKGKGHGLVSIVLK